MDSRGVIARRAFDRPDCHCRKEHSARQGYAMEHQPVVARIGYLVGSSSTRPTEIRQPRRARSGQVRERGRGAAGEQEQQRLHGPLHLGPVAG